MRYQPGHAHGWPVAMCRVSVSEVLFGPEQIGVITLPARRFILCMPCLEL